MSAGVSIDTRQFKDALKFLYANTTRELPDILNQRAFNIAARTVDSMLPLPGSEASTRSRIKGYMDKPKSEPRLRVVAAGPRRGQLSRVGRKADRLTLKNLLIQSRRAKQGKKGLYGQAMRTEAGEFSRRAQVGVGFLKSAFLPIIKGLHPLVKFKRVATRWGRISVWGATKGSVKPAKKGWSPFVEMILKWNVPGRPTKVQRMVLPKLQAAFNAEAREMVRHTTEQLQKAADKVNARWRQSTFQK